MIIVPVVNSTQTSNIPLHCSTIQYLTVYTIELVTAKLATLEYMWCVQLPPSPLSPSYQCDLSWDCANNVPEIVTSREANHSNFFTELVRGQISLNISSLHFFIKAGGML